MNLRIRLIEGKGPIKAMIDLTLFKSIAQANQETLKALIQEGLITKYQNGYAPIINKEPDPKWYFQELTTYQEVKSHNDKIEGEEGRLIFGSHLDIARYRGFDVTSVNNSYETVNTPELAFKEDSWSEAFWQIDKYHKRIKSLNT